MLSSHGNPRLDKRYKSAASMVFITFIFMILCGCTGRNVDLRSLGFSEPLKESRVIELSVKSEYMGREMPCKVYLPKGYGDGKEYPV